MRRSLLAAAGWTAAIRPSRPPDEASDEETTREMLASHRRARRQLAVCGWFLYRWLRVGDAFITGYVLPKNLWLLHRFSPCPVGHYRQMGLVEQSETAGA